eukprot:5155648-Pyramimonas_sp.AAC.1
MGLSCRANDTIERNGRQFVHACPYLLGDNIIQSGLRVDSEVGTAEYLRHALPSILAFCPRIRA